MGRLDAFYVGVSTYKSGRLDRSPDATAKVKRVADIVSATSSISRKERQMGSMSMVHWMIVIVQENEPIAPRTDDTPPGSTYMLAAPVSAQVGEKV
jgi:hypothetical protein